jgi:hypothetical protein
MFLKGLTNERGPIYLLPLGRGVGRLQQLGIQDNL